MRAPVLALLAVLVTVAGAVDVDRDASKFRSRAAVGGDHETLPLELVRASDAVQLLRKQADARDVEPWRFFYSPVSPDVYFWRRSGDWHRVPQWDGVDSSGKQKPGDLAFQDLRLSAESDKYAPALSAVKEAQTATLNAKQTYMIGTVSNELGSLVFRGEPADLAVHGAGLRSKLQSIPGISQFRVRKMVALLTEGQALTATLSKIRDYEAALFGYCNGAPTAADAGAPAPVLISWDGAAVNTAGNGPSGQKSIKATIAGAIEAMASELPEGAAASLVASVNHPGAKCMIGDAVRLGGSNEFLTAPLAYRFFSADFPRDVSALFAVHLRAVFGHLPSSFPKEHEVKRADVGVPGTHEAKWPSLWADSVDVLARPKMTPARSAYASALAKEVGRLYAASDRLSSAEYARENAPFNYQSSGLEGGAPLLQLGNMDLSQWSHNADKGTTCRGYMQVVMEGNFLAFTVTRQSSPVCSVLLRGSLSQSLGGMLVRGQDDSQSLLLLRHARVTVDLGQQDN